MEGMLGEPWRGSSTAPPRDAIEGKKDAARKPSRDAAGPPSATRSSRNKNFRYSEGVH